VGGVEVHKVVTPGVVFGNRVIEGRHNNEPGQIRSLVPVCFRDFCYQVSMIRVRSQRGTKRGPTPLDFANVRAYPPKSHSGIIVLRTKSQISGL
jgi:hypothetical protein